jgi:CO dehydrogenase maturation factor
MTRIAVSGKGGVGKTTVSALLAYILTESGRQVYAIDADPSPTLAETLGFPANITAQIRPIVEMEELIAERTGAKPGEYGSYFKLNPQVNDIPERFSASYRNIRLLEMGAVKGAGKGCACPENAILKALISHLLLQEQETIILDMVAGTEHLGRGTAQAVDAMVIVVERGTRSLKTAHTILAMAADLGITRLWIVGNKIRNADDQALIANTFPHVQIAGWLPFSNRLIDAERDGLSVYDADPELVAQGRAIVETILAHGSTV